MHGFSDFTASLKFDKKEGVVTEAFILSIDLQQIKRNDVEAFDIMIPPSEDYQLNLLDTIESKDSYARTHLHARYLIYPLREGNISITPSVVVKKASKEELKKFVTGSADELNYLQTKDKKITLKRCDISVKCLDRNVSLVGNYKLHYTLDKKKISSGERVNATYEIIGEGFSPNFEKLFDFDPKITIFTDKQVIDKKLFHKVIFNYSLSAEEDFIIPALKLQAYNPKTKNYYTLKAPEIKVDVLMHDLVKKSQNLQDNKINFLPYMNYFLLFIFGFAIQKILMYYVKNKSHKEVDLLEKINKTKSAKELLQLLLVHKAVLFQKDIEKLEKILYHDSSYDFKKIKSELIWNYKNDTGYHDSILD